MAKSLEKKTKKKIIGKYYPCSTEGCKYKAKYPSRMCAYCHSKKEHGRKARCIPGGCNLRDV